MHNIYMVVLGVILSVTVASNSIAKSASAPSFNLARAKACEAKLKAAGSRFSLIQPIAGPGQCGSPRPLILNLLKGNISLTDKVILRCEAALALSRWVADVVVPSAKLHLGAMPAHLNIATTYKCRRRNNSSGGRLSEHAYANGIDLIGIDFKGTKTMKIQTYNGNAGGLKSFQASIRGGACAYFTTVIGPTTNAAHADHLHLDLAERTNGYRVCE